MKKTSAGLLIYRRHGDKLEVLLVHPGGPFWAKKDDGAWGIPKGEYEEGEDPQTAARKEFEEEIGQAPPPGDYVYLGEMKRSDGKQIKAWAAEGDLDVGEIKSNTFEMEWPPRSGKTAEFAEVDKADWVELSRAPAKMHKGQDVFLQRLAEHLGVQIEPPEPAQSSLF
ncbi:MAG: hydrolase [Candidatus Saccharibacteria bacterium]|nr:hydrolase [Candidatus Saccharibacteria bacterium]